MPSFSPTPETILKKAHTGDTDALKAIAESLPKEVISGWLSHSDWKVRNAAVKVIGILQLENHKEKIIEFITDRTPARFVDRLFGGDYLQVGFIRRNAVKTLGLLSVPGRDAVPALLIAISDRYWEVRAEALRVFRNNYADCVSWDIIVKVALTLQDKKFEVVKQALHTLGDISDSSVILNDIRQLYDHPNNLVKIAVVKTLNTLHKRWVISSQEILRNELKNIFIPGAHNLNSNRIDY